MKPGNLFEDAGGAGEEINTLLEGKGFRLERIISRGVVSPADFWYDQPEDEWVALLHGTATLDFAGGGSMELKAGDFLCIAAHDHHRVAFASKDAIWLALHFAETVV